jgi:hypothetical protein
MPKVRITEINTNDPDFLIKYGEALSYASQQRAGRLVTQPLVITDFNETGQSSQRVIVAVETQGQGPAEIITSS